MKVDLVQTISQASFLVFIVCISAYFIFGDEEPSSKIEKFTDLNYNSKDALAKTITELFAEIYPNDVHYNPPSQQTIDFYVEYASVRKLTRADLREIIEGSAPSLVATLNQRTSNIPPKEIFGFEDEVAQVYNDLLFRNPDETEMYTYAKMLKTDKKFSIEKLKQILMASPEYKRLEMTQSNMYRSELIGGVTDRQVNMMVVSAYKTVVGNEDIDPDTMKFLKRKFLEFNLDEKKLRDFIKKYVKNEPYYLEKQPSKKERVPPKTKTPSKTEVIQTFTTQQLPTQTSQTSQTSSSFFPALTSTSKVFYPVVQEEKVVTQEKPVVASQTQTQTQTSVTQDDLIKMKAWMLSQQQASQTSFSQDEYDQVQPPNKQVIKVLLKTVSFR